MTDRPSDTEIRETIRHTIVELLERASKPIAPFHEDDELMSTGLTSLDLAALVAKLERRWRIDPFLEASTITEVRTVGDLCRVYREFINSA